MNPRRNAFRTSDLIRVAGAKSYQDAREPQLQLGNLVQLNSGGPRMMVVDSVDDSITAAFHDSEGNVQELTLPRSCIHRVSPL